MGLPMHLQGLLRPVAYPHAVSAVKLIETQLSWVLIAGERAYKIKRPVRFPFVDQRGLEERRMLCGQELRLNRRFAPQIYLDVAAVSSADGLAHIGDSGQPIEYAVVMRAFDGGNELDQLVLHQRVQPAEIGAFAQWLADAHAGLPRRNSIMGEESWKRTAAAAARNARECAAAGALFGTESSIDGIGAQLAAEFAAQQATINRRASRGFIRECHADLHLSNVVRLSEGLVPFDCLEFDAAMRWIDVAQDAAFLYADLIGYGEPGLAARFLDAYLQRSGDYEACILWPLFTADRALVRAKVLALQARDAQRAGAAQRPGGGAVDLLRQRHQRYLAVATGALNAPPPRCVMMCGLPGSGKSWLAAQLVTELPAVTLRSDLERKRLAGLDALSRSHSAAGAGLYSADQSALVYQWLMRCAAAVLEGRHTVIVDANFGQRGQRAALRDLSHALGVPLVVVECLAPLPILRQRIAARLARAHDPSEADLEVLEQQIGAREPIGADEGLTVIAADSSDADIIAVVRDRLRQALPAKPGP